MNKYKFLFLSFLLIVTSFQCKKLMTKSEPASFQISGKQGSFYEMAMSSNAEHFAVSLGDGRIGIYKKNGSFVKSINAHPKKYIHDLAVDPKNQYIVSAAKENNIKMWKINGSLYKVLRNAHKSEVTAVSFSKDGKHFFTGGDWSPIKMWSRSGSMIRSFGGNMEGVRAMDIDPNGEFIAVAGGLNDGKIRLFNFNGRLIRTFEGSSVGMNDIAVAPNGRYIAIISSPGSYVYVYNTSGKKFLGFNFGRKSVNKIIFSPNSKYIFAAGDKGYLYTLNLAEKSIDSTKVHSDKVIGIEKDSANKNLYTASYDGSIKFWPISNFLK
ncbi:MAG: hypothetical protein F6K39_37505 [Okeania sp. SIO3B3]|nr:hypothetical protein [Okeania sp. SIO3B3]